MKTTYHCITLPLAAAIALLPAFGSLSNLDKKYGTRGSSRQTTRKPAHVTRRQAPARPSKPTANQVQEQTAPSNTPASKTTSGYAKINPAGNKKLADALKVAETLYEAWQAGDEQTLMGLFSPKVDYATFGNNQESESATPREMTEALFDLPDECSTNLYCTLGYFLHGKTGKYGLLMFPENKEEKCAMHIIAFDDEMKICMFGQMPPSLFKESCVEMVETIAGPPSKKNAFEIVPLQIGQKDAPAKDGESTACPVKLSAAVGTWGGKDASFSDSPQLEQAEKMAPAAGVCNKLVYQYTQLRTQPRKFQEHQEQSRKLYAQLPEETRKQLYCLDFANSIMLLGENREVSRDEFLSMLQTRRMCWPLKARLEAVSEKGAHITAHYVFETFGFTEPVHIRTEFVLEQNGLVSAVGETQVSGPPRLLEGNAACTWGKTDTDLLNDPAVKAVTAPLEASRQQWMKSKASSMAKVYMANRGMIGMLNRRQGQFDLGDLVKMDSSDARVVGAAGDLSIRELGYALLDPALCFPENASIMDCGIRDFNKVEVIYKMELPSEDEPVYLKTLFVLDPSGAVIVIGETRCFNTDPALDEGFESINK